MRRRLARVGLVVLFLLVAFVQGVQAQEDRALVLVADSESGLDHLSPRQLRRVFLGLPVEVRGQPVRALLNTSDPLLNRVFLQKVVFMSQRRYARQLLSLTFRTGRRRPQAFRDQDQMVRTLHSSVGAIAVMWKRDAARDGSLKIMQTLWRGRLP